MTASERLEKRMSEIKVFAKKSLGQNFLVSDSVINKIIAAVDDESPERIIEVGPGCGALTDILLEKYKDITLIELDRDLAEFWRQQGQNVIEGDALRLDWDFAAGRVLVSNLPYQISSSLVIDRSLDEKPLSAMVLMFQKEVAQRIRAAKQTEHYGMLSVIAQEFWVMETVCDAGSREFKPAPKVSSRVLKFKPRVSNISNREEYLGFVKACFAQRRRVLTTNLSALPPIYDQEKFLPWLEQNKKTNKVRAEELSPAELNSLYFAMRKV
ncbi:MAG: dimethyladenosine transferase [Pseudobdellovibrio sp.]|nr:dimethyladenosine transferase [Pseudobdellovibrio sp.]